MKKTAVKLFALALVLSSTVACAEKPAKNLILMIGDGMGHTQKQAAAYLFNKPLTMDGMPIAGAMSNYASDNIATDSAAAATALATGYKTNNGMLSVTPKKQPIPTLLERSRTLGKAVGLVATSTVTHATPAAFGSHVDGRGDEGEIAAQFMTQKFDVLFGGGANYFLPKSQGGSRKDENNYIEQFKSSGYQYAWDAESLQSVKSAPAVGFFAPDKMAPDLDREVTKEPSLADMTSKAIDLLKGDPDGFFLMVEGSQIDWGGHDNDPAYDLYEVAAFDRAIAAALDFARKDGNTLVVVCADHETGGLVLVKGTISFSKLRILNKVTATGAFIANEIKGKDAAAIKTIFSDLTGITLKDTEANSFARNKDPKSAVNKLLSTKAGVSWATGDHSAAPVPVLAEGPGQELFSGWFDNTEIPKRMAKAAGFEL